MAKGAEEPQAINLDRSAQRHIEVVHAVHGVGCPEPTIYQFGRQRGGLERTVARREEQAALKVLPPSLGIKALQDFPNGDTSPPMLLY